MAYLITHPDHGIYLGSNQTATYWSLEWRHDLPGAAQTFATLEDAISHVSGWFFGIEPSAYRYPEVSDDGLGFVFEGDLIAQGFEGWSGATGHTVSADKETKGT